jgi:hypothetical protein
MRRSDERCPTILGKKRHDAAKQREASKSTLCPHEDYYEDEEFYDPDHPPPESREHVLCRRLAKLISKLIADNRSANSGEKQKFLCGLLACAIGVSLLNKRDPQLATKHPFEGKLKFRREGITNFTSIFRFVCDVECLLRELYGDVEGDDLDELLPAIWTIVMQFTKHLCPDIHQEYCDADEFECGQAWIVAPALTNRAMQVSVRPDDYGWYTKKFVKSLEKYWPGLISWIPGRPHRLKSTT